MTPFTKPWVKPLLIGVAVLVAIIAMAWAWNHYVAEPYRDQGRAEVQAKWDKHEKELALQHAENVKFARDDERRKEAEATKAATTRLKEIEHEKTELQASLDTERRAHKRLRTITGTISTGKGGMLVLPDAVTGDTSSCRAELPAEIGEGFERLREVALRIGSEANEVAIKLKESQRVHQLNSSQ